MFTPIPYSILSGDPFTRSSGGLVEGLTTLPAKKDVFTTTRGKMTMDAYNAASRSVAPHDQSPERRFLCETWVKYHAETEEAHALYKAVQANSRFLRDKGAGLSRDDVARLSLPDTKP